MTMEVRRKVLIKEKYSVNPQDNFNFWIIVLHKILEKYPKATFKFANVYNKSIKISEERFDATITYIEEPVMSVTKEFLIFEIRSSCLEDELTLLDDFFEVLDATKCRG